MEIWLSIHCCSVRSASRHWAIRVALPTLLSLLCIDRQRGRQPNIPNIWQFIAVERWKIGQILWDTFSPSLPPFECFPILPRACVTKEGVKIYTIVTSALICMQFVIGVFAASGRTHFANVDSGCLVFLLPPFVVLTIIDLCVSVCMCLCRHTHAANTRLQDIQADR